MFIIIITFSYSLYICCHDASIPWIIQNKSNVKCVMHFSFIYDFILGLVGNNNKGIRPKREKSQPWDLLMASPLFLDETNAAVAAYNCVVPYTHYMNDVFYSEYLSFQRRSDTGLPFYTRTDTRTLWRKHILIFQWRFIRRQANQCANWVARESKQGICPPNWASINPPILLSLSLFDVMNS